MRIESSSVRPPVSPVDEHASGVAIAEDALDSRVAERMPEALLARGADLRSDSGPAAHARALVARSGAEALLEAERAPAAEGREPVASPSSSASTDRALAALGDLLLQASSSELLLAALEQALSSRSRQGLEGRIEDAQVDATQAAAQRAEARARAARAARRARRASGHAPKWVRKLLKAVLAVAGVAAAACTGGAAAGIAIAGLVLTLGAPAFEKTAEKLGLDPSKARWIGFACQLAGAALSSGAGIASAPGAIGAARGAVDAGRTVAEVADTARSVVEGVTGLVDGARGAAGAVLERQVTNGQVAAEREGVRLEAAQDVIGELADALRLAMGHAERIARFAADVMEVRNGAREALLGALAGGRA